MKIRISHLNGKYDNETGADLCEVFGTPDGETYKELFETGWLPTKNGEWYQSRSSRVKIDELSGTRRYEVRKLKVSNEGDWERIFGETKHLYPNFQEDYIRTCLSFNHEIYYFDDSVFAILNWFDDIPFFSTVVGGRMKKNGITPLTCYYFIQKLLDHSYPYLYISEWYDQFKFKANYPNFEWWDGESWIKK
jgi:hypothetical protein